jgi:hypothetical protein
LLRMPRSRMLRGTTAWSTFPSGGTESP